MEKRTLAIFAVSCNLFLSTSLFAQQQRVDTARTYYIPEITGQRNNLRDFMGQRNNLRDFVFKHII